MTKDEAYEVIDESLGGSLCYDCPYFLIGHDKVDESDTMHTWKDCMVDNPHFCIYVQMEEELPVEHIYD